MKQHWQGWASVSASMLSAALLVPRQVRAGEQPDTAGVHAPLPSGSRVRVFAPGLSKPLVGQLVASDDTTLTVQQADNHRVPLGWPFRHRRIQTFRLPRASVIRLEQSVRPSRKSLGALIGGTIGFVAAAVAVETQDTTGEGCSGCGIVYMGAAALFGRFGAAIAPGDRWAAADAATVRVGFAPVRGGGVGFRLAVTFWAAPLSRA